MGTKRPVSKREALLDALLLIGVILCVPSIMVCLSLNGYDPSDVFAMLAGFIIIGIYAFAYFGLLVLLFPPLIYPFVFAAYPFIRMYQWLTKDKKR